jgi:hypothetical protein
MTKQNAAHLRTLQSRIRRLQPAIARAYLRALDAIGALLTTGELEALVAGRLTLIEVFSNESMRRITARYRAEIRGAVQEAARLTLPDIKKFAPTVSTAFNFLDPKVITAIRALETDAMDTLSEQVREVTRAYIENGIRDGKGVPAMARQLRTVVGMAPHQERYIDNLARELRELSPRFKDRVLRDKRYDRMILRAIREGKPLPEAKIEQITAAYRRRFRAHNTEVVTRQVTLDSYREGNRLAWEQAVADGYIDAEALVKVWVHSDIVQTPRPEHLALDGVAVPYDQPFPNGQQIPGVGDFGCACSMRMEVRAKKGALVPVRVPVVRTSNQLYSFA